MSERTRILPGWAAISGAVIVGVLTAVQARINGQLGVEIGDGFVAAVISFGSGLVILALLSVALPAGRRGVERLVVGVREKNIPWWMLAGGAAGALTVATQGLAVGIIGVALFTVGMVAGQTVCGLVLDRTGYGPAGVVAVTIPRLVGGALALAAVGSTLAGDTVRGIPPWMLLLPFLTGAGIAWQQATNGRLRQQVGTPLTATLVNFIGGTVVLFIAAAIHVAFAGVPARYPTELWLYLGGAVGVAYIFLSAALVQYTGVLLFGLAAVVGQLVSAALLDLLWPAPASPGIAAQAVMLVLALLAVIVAASPWRRARR